MEEVVGPRSVTAGQRRMPARGSSRVVASRAPVRDVAADVAEVVVDAVRAVATRDSSRVVAASVAATVRWRR
jgi:hypothetical protein